MKNFSIAVAVVLALGVGGFFAARYTRRASHDLTAEPAASGSKPTVQFVKNPVAVRQLTLKTIDGRTLDSRDWKGKETLLNFWATSCPPCREEIPDLIKLRERYKNHRQIIRCAQDQGPLENVST